LTLGPLKLKGRSENTVYPEISPFPLELRGREGVRVQKQFERIVIF